MCRFNNILVKFFILRVNNKSCGVFGNGISFFFHLKDQR